MQFQGIEELQRIAATQIEDWFISNWLEFGSLAMLCGDPFSGKSSIVAEMIASACKWGKFGPHEIPAANVLLIDLENKESIIVRRLERATEGDLGCLEGQFHKASIPESHLPLDTDTVEGMLLEFKETAIRGKTVLVIDTFRSAFDASELDVDEVKRLLYPLQRVARRHQVAILILHHRPKSGAKYSGGTGIAAALDYLWLWESEPEKRRAVLSLEDTGRLAGSQWGSGSTRPVETSGLVSP
ncbi:MAG: AAA family ATPase [Planctomycetaceae bacterium]